MDFLILFFILLGFQFQKSFGNEIGTCDAESCDKSNFDIIDDDINNYNTINVLITFTNAVHKTDFHEKFKLTVGSLFKHTTSHIYLYILGDDDSKIIANDLLQQVVKDKSRYELGHIDIERVVTEMKSTIESMQDHFSPKQSGSYYSQALFFLSPILHRILPNEVEKVIMLDADLKFESDISNLYKHFYEFKEDNVIGIAREAQPVYRHAFSSYRSKHRGTKVGEPPPEGLTGFNSGVLLLDLSKMRQSQVYNNLLKASEFSRLADEFEFRGHLGDQDYYTLISMKYTSLFYILPCQWNRQLCQWWKERGYEEVFHLYFDCTGDIHLYHGNCNTPIV